MLYTFTLVKKSAAGTEMLCQPGDKTIHCRLKIYKRLAILIFKNALAESLHLSVFRLHCRLERLPIHTRPKRPQQTISYPQKKKKENAVASTSQSN